MDLQQQMLLAAWLRPPLPNLPTISSSSNNSSSSAHSILLESPSPSSSTPSLTTLRHLITQQHSSAPTQAPVIRRVASSSQLAVFDPNQLATPAIGSSSMDPSTCLFGPPPSSLDHPQFCPPFPTQFHHQIGASSTPPPPPPHLNHLMALAVHEMLEKLRAAENAAQKQQQTIGQHQQAPNAPLLDHSLPNHPHFGLHPSAFSAVHPSSMPAEMITKIVPKSHPAEEHSMEKPSKEICPPPLCQKLIVNHQFVPSPSTSADELLEEALCRLVQQWDGERENGNGGSHQKGTTMTNLRTTTAAAGDNSTATQQGGGRGGGGQEGPSSTNGTIQSDGVLEEVLLCKVCSDKASGFHYGIFSCEGCKGFFRRSLQNKIDYRPCTQSQKCQIVRANRNRCQECRWRKCIEAGMSKDGVRYGRVPKREKEKMREQMQRDSVRTLQEQLALDLGGDEGGKMMLDKLERGWTELGHEIADELNGGTKGEEEMDKVNGLVDASKLCALAKAVVRFAGKLIGFRLIRRDDRVQLIKESMYPILLLRLCAKNGPIKCFDDLHRDCAQSMAINKLCSVFCVPQSHRNSQLFESSAEFVHRLREAKPPVEIAFSDRQLAICAAICLCKLDGAYECAAGGGGTNSATMSCAWEEQCGQLAQLVCRRLRECLLRLLDATLGAFGSESGSNGGPVVCQFGPALLRTDLLFRQNLAAVFERLKHCRDLYRQFLLATNCWNIPLELFASSSNHSSPPSTVTTIKLEMPTTILGQTGEARKRRAGEEGGGKERRENYGAEEKKQQKQTNDNKNGNKTRKQADLLPTLRRALEQPSTILYGQKGGEGNGGKRQQKQQKEQCSLKERHREMAELLERPSLIPPMEDEEQPLNLCIRDGQ